VEVRADERRLLARGRPLDIGGRAFDLLICLIEAHSRVVGEDELMQRVWPNVVVGDNNLTTQVANLRMALGAQAVVTVAGRGYKFGLPLLPGVTAPDEAGAVARLGQMKPPADLQTEPSIAVLPLLNLSDDPGQEAFVDGITEDLITELSRFRSLLVIARTSSFAFKGQSVDVRRAGRALGVRYVLEGSVRRHDQHVRVTAQLMDAQSACTSGLSATTGRLTTCSSCRKS
jgi:TolB-like protein